MKKTLGIVVLGALLLVMAYSLFVSNALEIRLSKSVPEIDSHREARVLTAFFGLDNALPIQGIFLYRKAPGKDGMPVVFSQEIDPATLDSSDFEVISKDGSNREVEFVTLKPANEEFELRTALLIGEFGDHPQNPPLSVNIVGDLMSRSGQNYKGQSAKVIPLPEGPIISYAEFFTFDEDYPYVESGRGCDCPPDETGMVVRAVWSGGVRAIDGKELGENELEAFQVTMVQGKDTLQVHPFKLADLNDNDNNLDLCLKEKGVPILVEAKAGIAIDPRGDANPQTQRTVVSRW